MSAVRSKHRGKVDSACLCQRPVDREYFKAEISINGCRRPRSATQQAPRGAGVEVDAEHGYGEENRRPSQCTGSPSRCRRKGWCRTRCCPGDMTPQSGERAARAGLKARGDRARVTVAGCARDGRVVQGGHSFRARPSRGMGSARDVLHRGGFAAPSRGCPRADAQGNPWSRCTVRVSAGAPAWSAGGRVMTSPPSRGGHRSRRPSSPTRMTSRTVGAGRHGCALWSTRREGGAPC